MTEPLRFTHPMRVAELAGRKPTRFRIAPGAKDRAAIAAALGVTELDQLRFEGDLTPLGRQDWRLTARLSARVVQPCIVTLAPVKTEIDETVTRRYLADLPEPEGEEIEIPEDDSIEALPATIDLGAVLTEALALSLPLYPRAEGAEMGSASFAEPGAEPLGEEVTRPFAGLADLMKKRDPKG